MVLIVFYFRMECSSGITPLGQCLKLFIPIQAAELIPSLWVSVLRRLSIWCLHKSLQSVDFTGPTWDSRRIKWRTLTTGGFFPGSVKAAKSIHRPSGTRFLKLVFLCWQVMEFWHWNAADWWGSRIQCFLLWYRRLNPPQSSMATHKLIWG